MTNRKTPIFNFCDMYQVLFRSFFFLCVISATTLTVSAQLDASNRTSRSREELPSGMKETMAKGRIEREKKDFAELLEHGDEALKISAELEKSFSQNNRLTTQDQKKLARLEKLYKKIRQELGGNSDDEGDELNNQSSSLSNALKTLHSNTVQLVDELKKTTRYTISVVAVESSNMLLKVVRILRFQKN